VKKWKITIVVTDLKGEHSADSLVDDIKIMWLPPSHDLELNELKVGLIEEKVKDGE
jgi:hypothetical protein